MVLTQFISMFFVKDLSYPMLFLLAYCFGGVINHSLMLGKQKYTLINLDKIFNLCIYYILLNVYEIKKKRLFLYIIIKDYLTVKIIKY